MTEKRTTGQMLNIIDKLIYENKYHNAMLSDLISHILHGVSRLNESFDFEEVEKSINEYLIEHKKIENKRDNCYNPEKQKDLINLTCNFYINILNKCKF